MIQFRIELRQYILKEQTWHGVRHSIPLNYAVSDLPGIVEREEVLSFWSHIQTQAWGWRRRGSTFKFPWKRLIFVDYSKVNLGIGRMVIETGGSRNQEILWEGIGVQICYFIFEAEPDNCKGMLYHLTLTTSQQKFESALYLLCSLKSKLVFCHDLLGL